MPQWSPGPVGLKQQTSPGLQPCPPQGTEIGVPPLDELTAVWPVDTAVVTLVPPPPPVPDMPSSEASGPPGPGEPEPEADYALPPDPFRRGRPGDPECAFVLKVGEELVIVSPGGGGFGVPDTPQETTP